MEYCIDCSGITDPKQLHRVLAQTLAFPEWYGNNLDALYDCLTELPQDTMVLLNNWNPAFPWAEGFRQTFEDACSDCPELTVTIHSISQEGCSCNE